MRNNQIYSFELYDWVKERLPKEIIQAMSETGWNAFGIYELVKEGLSLDQKGNLINQSTVQDGPCPKGGNHEWGTDGMHSNIFCKKCFGSKAT